MAANQRYFQKPGDPRLDRTDHVWCYRGADYICVLCGGVTTAPPFYPTPNHWLPESIERLTDAERAQCPQPAVV